MSRLYWVYRVVFDTSVVLGTGYVVFVLGRSVWWWLLAFVLIATTQYKQVSIKYEDD